MEKGSIPEDRRVKKESGVKQHGRDSGRFDILLLLLLFMLVRHDIIVVVVQKGERKEKKEAFVAREKREKREWMMGRMCVGQRDTHLTQILTFSHVLSLSTPCLDLILPTS